MAPSGTTNQDIMDTSITFEERVSEVDAGSWWAALRVEEGWLGPAAPAGIGICRELHKYTK